MLCFSDGCDWLFEELHKHGVPLLILSAGIGDIIIEAIKQRATLRDNIRVVSNFMDFDEQVRKQLVQYTCQYYRVRR